MPNAPMTIFVGEKKPKAKAAKKPAKPAAKKKPKKK